MTPDSHGNGQARHHGKHLVNPETTPQSIIRDIPPPEIKSQYPRPAPPEPAPTAALRT
ncbi:hypothetical protein HHJ81_08930 [Mobiluncus mulieris]|uniref:hypothetical protein n=1 Tax=Mobiluncus mulieris TaxID=2052 RepID=UPI00147068B0|nr:hypothetical protein [Mobiluncus mulieris]NMW61205.1 hypothetical protein [Mobiluncus mulieris]